MTTIPNRRHGDRGGPAASATASATANSDSSSGSAPAPSEQQVRARAAFLFRDTVREGLVHPLMPLLIRYRLQREAP